MAEFTLPWPPAAAPAQPPPRIVRFAAWVRNNRQALIDLLILLALGGGACFYAVTADVAETFFEYSREHEEWELDDTVLSAAVIISVGALIFSTRRWREAAAQLRRANTDSLTGVLNRRSGMEVLEAEARRATRYQRPLAVILVDIDHFKAINDRLGHLAGDAVLRGVARVLRDTLRGTDSLIRWGGEEFVIVAVETDAAQGRELAERLRAALQAAPPKNVERLTASLGVAQFTAGESVTAFVERADMQMYAAKRAGRNRVR